MTKKNIVKIGYGLNPELFRYLSHKKVVIITDNKVKNLYGNALKTTIDSKGLDSVIISFKAGEQSKNQRTKTYLEEKMLQLGCGRDTVIIALGGGVVGDIAGFVAATYMRGIPYIQMPTTLLAMVDSSIGGKTAIDTKYGKNMIGAFWQPLAVFADIDYLKTLPKKQINNGLIEAIKVVLLDDKTYFKYVEKNIANIDKIRQSIIKKAIAIKSKIVVQDIHDNHTRMLLNFGHTIGHALEHISNYKLLHGYAVGLGMLIECRMSMLLGFMDLRSYERIEKILFSLGITSKLIREIKVNSITNAIKSDKKSLANTPRFILLKAIGEVVKNKNQIAHSVPDNIVKQAIIEFMELSS